MDKVASNEELSAREASTEVSSAQINSLIKQHITLKQLLDKASTKEQYWRNLTSKLLDSNRNIGIRLDKLVQNVSDVNANVSANVRLHNVTKRELKNLQSARADLSHKQWEKSLTEIGNYANELSNWITEYSRNVLMKDIASHNEECEKVGEELELLRKELNIMRNEFDADCIRANVDTGDLPNINNAMFTVKAVNNNLTHSIRLAEDTLNKIENKIKQSNAAINEYKIKEKANMF